MKRFLLLLLSGVIFLQIPLLAQDANTAAAIAQRQEAEERYKRMSADVESVLASNIALQRKVSALENELVKLRDDQSRRASDNSTAESVRKLADKIQEVDRKRESDKDLILAEIKTMGKTLSAPAPRQRSPVAVETKSGPEKGYTYEIQSGDTLSAILNDYNAEFKAKGMKTLTTTQVMNANPNVSWNKLKIGQKIVIPMPGE